MVCNLLPGLFCRSPVFYQFYTVYKLNSEILVMLNQKKWILLDEKIIYDMCLAGCFTYLFLLFSTKSIHMRACMLVCYRVDTLFKENCPFYQILYLIKMLSTLAFLFFLFLYWFVVSDGSKTLIHFSLVILFFLSYLNLKLGKWTSSHSLFIAIFFYNFCFFLRQGYSV